MQNPPPVQTGKSSTGLDENIAALLAYVFGWLSGLILFLMEKDSRLVRFHAMQSILLNVAIAVLAIVVGVAISILILILGQVSGALAGIASVISLLFWLAFAAVIVVIWVLCLIRAYQGKMFKLPFIGDMADKIVNK
jgi:uncharacterized membrane protein